jgi:RHS repeat-associated protein
MSTRLLLTKGSGSVLEFGVPDGGGKCTPLTLDRNALRYDTASDCFIERQPDGLELVYERRPGGSVVYSCACCGDCTCPPIRFPHYGAVNNLLGADYAVPHMGVPLAVEGGGRSQPLLCTLDQEVSYGVAQTLPGTYGHQPDLSPVYASGVGPGVLDVAWGRAATLLRPFDVPGRFAGADLGAAAFACGVNLTNGNLLISLSLPDAGPAAPPVRLFYNSQIREPSSLGIGWRTLYDQFLVRSGPSVNGLGRLYVLTKIRNIAGKQWTVVRGFGDLDVRVTKLSDPFLAETTFTYTSSLTNSVMASVTDAVGRVTSFTVDDGTAQVGGRTLPRRLLRKITLPSLPACELDYGDTGLLLGWKNPVGSTTRFAYDRCRRVVRVTLPGGGVTKINYVDDTVRTITDPSGYVTTVTLDGNYQVNIVQQQEGVTNTYTWDANHRLTGFTDGRSNTTSFSYTTISDGSRRLASIRRPTGTFTYDHDTATGLLRSVTNELGGIATLTWTSGQRTALQDVSNTYTFSNNANGQLVTVSDTLARSTQWAYDTQGRLTAVTNGEGETTSLSYDGKNRVEVVINPLTQRTTYGYDDMNRLTSVVDANGNTMTYGYDDSGRSLSRNNGIATWTTSYDDVSRTVSHTSPPNADGALAGNVTTLVFDTSLNLIRSISPRGNTTAFGYDKLHRQQTVTDPLMHTITYGYDPSHNRVTLQNALGQVWTTVYDAANRAQAVIDSLGRTNTYSYDAADNCVGQTNAMSQATVYGYDLLLRRTTVKDANLNITTTTYDAAGRVWTTARRADASTLLVVTMGYDKADRLKTTVDPRGFTTTFNYDLAGRRNEVVDPLLHTATTVYEPSGRVQAVVDAEGVRTTYLYDHANQLEHVVRNIDATNVQTSSTYYPDGSVRTQANELGHTTTFTYDADGHQETVAIPVGYPGSPASAVTTTHYDKAGRKEWVKSAEQNLTSFVYDEADRLINVVNGLGKTLTYEYDLAGQLTTMTTPLGIRTTFAYDLAGRQTHVTNGAGETQQTVYDPAGRQIAAVDPLGNRTTFIYDNADRVIGTQDARLKITTHVYDGSGNLIVVQTPLNRRTTLHYDQAGRRDWVQDGAGAVTSFTYFKNNLAKEVVTSVQRTSLTLELHTTTYDYDSANRLRSVTDPLNQRTTTVYDRVDRVIAVINPLTHPTTTTYYDDGKVRETIEPLNGTAQSIVTYSYDQDRRNTEVITASGATSFRYDAANQLTTMTVSAGSPSALQVTTYAYDEDGRQMGMTDPRPGVTTYTYYDSNRLKTHRLPGGLTYTFTYDAAGNRLTSVDPLATTTYSYDVLNRLQTQKRSGTSTLTYAYDDDGDRQSMSASAVGGLAYSYDGMGRIKTVTSGSSSGTATTTFTYDEEGRELTRLLPNGITVSSTYDAGGRLLTHRYLGSSGQIVTGVTHTYDAASFRTGVTQVSGNTVTASVTYTPDHSLQVLNENRTGGDGLGWADLSVDAWATMTLDKLESLSKEIIAFLLGQNYDLIGNALTSILGTTGTTNSYDASNRVLTQSRGGTVVATYTFDGAGNRTSVTTPSGVTTYTWDGDNRLRRVDLPSVPATYSRSFSYDPDGLLSRSEGSDTANYPPTRYLWDGAALLATLAEADGQPVSWYTQAPGGYGDVISARLQQLPLTYTAYPLYDGSGNVSKTTDAQGQVVDSAAYDAFGLVQSSSSRPDPVLGYGGRQGYMYFPDLQLYYVRQRWYDPATHQWLSPDRIGLAGGDANLYRYADNDPVGKQYPNGGAMDIDIIAHTLIGTGVGGAVSTPWGNYLTKWADPKLQPLKRGFPINRGLPIDYSITPGQVVENSVYSRRSQYIPVSEHWMGADYREPGSELFRLYYIDRDQVGRVVEQREILASLRQLEAGGKVRPRFPDIWKETQSSHRAGNPWYRVLFFQKGEREVLIKGSVAADAVRSPFYVWGTRSLRGLTILAAARTVKNITTAVRTGNQDTIADVTVSEASSWALSYAGAEFGASIGFSVSGPLGAVVGGLVGGFGGSVTGSLLLPGYKGASRWAHKNIHPVPGSMAAMTVMPGGVIDTFGGPRPGVGLDAQLRYLELTFGNMSREASTFRRYMQQERDWHPPLAAPQLQRHIKDLLLEGGYP